MSCQPSRQLTMTAPWPGIPGASAGGAKVTPLPVRLLQYSWISRQLSYTRLLGSLSMEASHAVTGEAVEGGGGSTV